MEIPGGWDTVYFVLDIIVMVVVVGGFHKINDDRSWRKHRQHYAHRIMQRTATLFHSLESRLLHLEPHARKTNLATHEPGRENRYQLNHDSALRTLKYELGRDFDGIVDFLDTSSAGISPQLSAAIEEYKMRLERLILLLSGLVEAEGRRNLYGHGYAGEQRELQQLQLQAARLTGESGIESPHLGLLCTRISATGGCEKIVADIIRIGAAAGYLPASVERRTYRRLYLWVLRSVIQLLVGLVGAFIGRNIQNKVTLGTIDIGDGSTPASRTLKEQYDRLISSARAVDKLIEGVLKVLENHAGSENQVARTA